MTSKQWHERFSRIVRERREREGRLVDEHGNVLYEAGDRARSAARAAKEKKE